LTGGPGQWNADKGYQRGGPLAGDYYKLNNTHNPYGLGGPGLRNAVKCSEKLDRCRLDVSCHCNLSGGREARKVQDAGVKSDSNVEKN